MNTFKVSQTFSLFLLVIFCCVAAADVRGQGKQAIVILRPGGADAGSAGCEGSADLSYQIIYDAKLNAKDEIRLLNSAGASTSSNVSRDAYDHSGKSKMRDLFALKWGRDGVLYAVSVAGQAPIMALPDNMKPQKNVASQPVSAFYGVMLSGEARENKQKRKIDLALRAIWKVYFLPDGAAVNDTLFSHVAEEASVSLWEAYLQKTNNYRAGEANAKMRDALVVCARGDLDRFSQGDYGSLDQARQKATRAQSVKDDDSTRQLVADIRGAQQQVENARSKAEQLIKAEKWDEAIDASEPIRKYLESWPDLSQMYRHALEQSHEIHLNACDKEFLGNQLEASLNDCSIARSRLPNSEKALLGVCRARNEIALRDEKKARQIKHPKDAKELLEKQLADSDCTQDKRLIVELKDSKCEYAQQLYLEARQLLGAGGVAPRPAGARRRGVPASAQPVNMNVNLKLITMQNKKDFREAREKLLLASQMCLDDGIHSLLEATNRRLSDFCVAEAKSALQRSNDGTAYVYLQSAQLYTPDDGTVSGLLSEARERFQQKTRVSIGAAFESSVRSEAAGVLLSEVTDAIHSAGAEAGLAQPNLLDNEQSAAAWRSIQGGRPMNSPTVIFTGTLLAAGVDVSANPHNVSSSYTYENRAWKDADRVHDAKNEEYKNCRKQYGDAPCAQLKAQVDQLRAYRDQFPRNITERYYYRENPIRMVGGARMSLRLNDSIARGAQGSENLQAADQWECVERSGVNPQDYSARDSSCPEPNREAFFGGIVGKIKQDAHIMAVAALQELPGSYYKRAQGAANRQQAVEDYLRFLFLTGRKSGSEAEQAKAALLAYDPELNTDGVLR
jgi:hypothetical protein